MLLEFAGESGCGKSTYAKYIADNDTKYVLKPSVSNTEVILSFFRLIAKGKYRRLFFSLNAMCIHSFGGKRVLKNALYIMKLLYAYSKDSPEKITILDQGIIQLLHTIYFYKDANNDKRSEIITNLIQSFDVYFVICECPYDVLKQRIIQRKDNYKAQERRIESLLEDKEMLSYHQKVFSSLKEIIGVENLLIIDTSKALHDNYVLLDRWIGMKYAK